MPTDDLSRAFLGSGPAGYGVSSVMGAVLTVWNYPGPDPANPVYSNVVTDGAYTFTNCIVLQPSLLQLGRVLLLKSDAGMIILGNSYQEPPATVATSVPSPGTTMGDATLVWSDEFTGTSLSLATDGGGGTWRTRGYEGGGSVNQGYTDFAGSSWNVSPGQHPADFPVTVANSTVTITAKRNPGLSGVSNGWIGAYLVTNHVAGLAWRYGYFEVRAQFPDVGRGMFPALWLFNNVATRSDGKEGAELDILEVFGEPDGLPWSSGWHNNPTPGESGNAGNFSTDITGWHRYGLDWTPTAITWYRDGVQVAQLTGANAEWFQGADLGVRINYAMDPNWLTAGDPNKSTSSDPAPGVELRMLVDYVRVFDKKPATLPTGPSDPLL